MMLSLVLELRKDPQKDGLWVHGPKEGYLVLCQDVWPCVAGRAPGLCSGLAGRGVLAVLTLLCESDTTL